MFSTTLLYVSSSMNMSSGEKPPFMMSSTSHSCRGVSVSDGIVAACLKICGADQQSAPSV
jgi:hypothetical protein